MVANSPWNPWRHFPTALPKWVMVVTIRLISYWVLCFVGKLSKSSCILPHPLSSWANNRKESTSSWRLLKECNMALKSSRGELQLWFRPHSNWRSEPGDMSSQSLRTPILDIFGTPFWESREKEPFECSLHQELQRILYGGRWWLPPSLGRGKSSESKCSWLVPTPKGVPKCELTLLWLVLDADSSEIILVPLPSLIPGLLVTRSQVTGWNSLEGFPKSSCGKLRLGSTLPASNSKKG